MKTRADAPMADSVNVARAMAAGWRERPGGAPGARAAGVRAVLVDAARGRAGGQGWRRGPLQWPIVHNARPSPGSFGATAWDVAARSGGRLITRWLTVSL